MQQKHNTWLVPRYQVLVISEALLKTEELEFEFRVRVQSTSAAAAAAAAVVLWSTSAINNSAVLPTVVSWLDYSYTWCIHTNVRRLLIVPVRAVLLMLMLTVLIVKVFLDTFLYLRGKKCRKRRSQIPLGVPSYNARKRAARPRHDPTPTSARCSRIS